MILLSTTAAVVGAGTAAISYELTRYRRALVADLTTHADIIGGASAAALAFDDAAAGAQTLAALRALPEIVSARLYRIDGTLFADYRGPRSERAALRSADRTETFEWELGTLLLCRPVALAGDGVGTICLRADLHEARARVVTYAWIVLGVIGGSLVLGWVVSRGLQRTVTTPILDLAGLARRISRDQDASHRASPQGKDEIGQLMTDFNQMLDRLQERDAAVRASEERFRQLAESIREVFWMTDPDKCEMLYISPGYERVWGRSCASLYAAPGSWLEAIHPDDRERVRLAALTKQAKGDYHEEYRILRPDGAERWILDRAFPIRDPAGKVYRVVGLAEDITDSKRLHEQLGRAEKMELVGRLAAGVAHEVKNPLAALSMGVDYLSQNLPQPDEETRLVLGEMEKAVARASSVAGELLDFSRPRALRVEPEDVNEVIERSVGLVRHELQRGHVTLLRELGRDLPPLRLDRHKMEQVFINLFINAIHAMKDGGKLTVRTYRARGAPPGGESAPAPVAGSNGHSPVVIEVDDTGPGIAPDHLPRLFDPFFSTKPLGVGTGLGLSVVRQIVQTHGGVVDIRNGPSGGARVTIAFPPADGNPG